MSRVRVLLYGAAALALATLCSPDAIRSALAATASALVEATPFLVAGIAAAHLLRRRAIVEHLGCGCGAGPSARSIPAAAATWLTFGPAIAIARYAAALASAAILNRARARRNACQRGAPHLLGELAAVLPAAALAGAALQFAAGFDLARLPAIAAAGAGAAFGFAASPCGLGAVALAGALRVQSPLTAAAFLCVAGIADLRALRRAPHAAFGHDAFAYALLAAALGIVAWRRGASLVHPALSIPLACSAIAALLAAATRPRAACAAARFAPSVMLAGALLGAPPPQYRATATTLTDLFAGERLTFDGALARDAGSSAVVRYAITCCRADAAPVAVALDRSPPYPNGTWLRVDGRVESRGGRLRLVATSVARIPAPDDPFLYR